MTPRLAEALAAWRALSGGQRASTIDEFETARDSMGHAGRDVDDLDAALALLRAAAEPEAKDGWFYCACGGCGVSRQALIDGTAGGGVTCLNCNTHIGSVSR